MANPKRKMLSVRVTEVEYFKLEVIAEARKHRWQRKGNVSNLVRMHIVDLIAKWEEECRRVDESISQAKSKAKAAVPGVSSTRRKAV